MSSIAQTFNSLNARCKLLRDRLGPKSYVQNLLASTTAQLYPRVQS